MLGVKDGQLDGRNPATRVGPEGAVRCPVGTVRGWRKGRQGGRECKGWCVEGGCDCEEQPEGDLCGGETVLYLTVAVVTGISTCDKVTTCMHCISVKVLGLIWYSNDLRCDYE